MWTISYLQSVDIRQIYDKFPEKKGGLKELYDKGPQAAFFLVKFWVRISALHSKEQTFGYPSLVLVQPRKTRPCTTERLLMGRKESNQKQTFGEEISG